MQDKTITILIDENGDSSIDLEGFAGSGCGKALDDFRGDDPMRLERKKPSYYSQTSNDQQQQNKR